MRYVKGCPGTALGGHLLCVTRGLFSTRLTCVYCDKLRITAPRLRFVRTKHLIDWLRVVIPVRADRLAAVGTVVVTISSCLVIVFVAYEMLFS
jgi:hypothetical protein